MNLGSAPSSFQFIPAIADLNLSMRVPKEPWEREFVGYGGYSDVFKGTLLSHRLHGESCSDFEQSEKRTGTSVAIKTLRTFLTDDAEFHKVTYFNSTECY